MTAPLPERIAAAIDDLTVAQAECTWAEAGTFTLRVDKEARAKEARDARSNLVAAIAEVVAEREQYRAVVARQVDDKRRLFAERNEARAVLELVAGNLAAWSDKREEAPASAQEHMGEAMHALVRFRPEGGYSEAASKLRLEMWHGEIYAERDKLRTALMDVCNNATFGHCAGAVTTEFLLAVPAEAASNFARLRSQRDAATKRADGLAEREKEALTMLQVMRDTVSKLAKEKNEARTDLAAAQAKLAEVDRKRQILADIAVEAADWLAGLAGRPSCSCDPGDLVKRLLSIAAAEQGGA